MAVAMVVAAAGAEAATVLVGTDARLAEEAEAAATSTAAAAAAAAAAGSSNAAPQALCLRGRDITHAPQSYSCHRCLQSAHASAVLPSLSISCMQFVCAAG